MRHGALSRATAAKIRKIRDRIEEAKIPPSKLDENLILGTWNVREFGKRQRGDDAIHLIAEIISQFDLLALVELRDDLRDLGRVMDILGGYWRVVYSDYRTDYAGNRERLAFVYDKRMVTFTGLAAEADEPRKKIEGRYQSKFAWWRSPYMASFRAGNFDFVVLATHMRWGDSVSERAVAIGMLADWIEERRTDDTAVDKDFIVLGDFNIPSKRSKTFKALTKHGLAVPKGLLGVKGTNLSEKNTYDQIVHSATNPERFTDKGGVIRLFESTHKELFPNLSKNNFTYQLSDHLPLWIEIDSWIEDEQLSGILNPPAGN